MALTKIQQFRKRNISQDLMEASGLPVQPQFQLFALRHAFGTVEEQIELLGGSHIAWPNDTIRMIGSELAATELLNVRLNGKAFGKLIWESFNVVIWLMISEDHVLYYDYDIVRGRDSLNPPCTNSLHDFFVEARHKADWLEPNCCIRTIGTLWDYFAFMDAQGVRYVLCESEEGLERITHWIDNLKEMRVQGPLPATCLD